MKRTASAVKKPKSNAISIKAVPRRTTEQFVVCVENSEYPASLELHKIYRVIPDREAQRMGDLRIVDESGEDYLYPAEWFISVRLSQQIKRSLLHSN